ncbi:hypothetical protein RHMOL_Rhmol01G0260600 [Rhododendron molle]|uniref:Uncharacterized protein n=1 Tax=Rhododendron molle TaxID=49168 RepID=A0ACC0Q893_RHOML|nr:hypothetical protein RHMOL_Rhmol01G0260600 [Rhododendron molle]
MGNAIFWTQPELHLQHHVAVVVEVAVPQCQALNHQVQPQPCYAAVLLVVMDWTALLWIGCLCYLCSALL